MLGHTEDSQGNCHAYVFSFENSIRKQKCLKVLHRSDFQNLHIGKKICDALRKNGISWLFIKEANTASSKATFSYFLQVKKLSLLLLDLGWLWSQNEEKTVYFNLLIAGVNWKVWWDARFWETQIPKCTQSWIFLWWWLQLLSTVSDWAAQP